MTPTLRLRRWLHPTTPETTAPVTAAQLVAQLQALTATSQAQNTPLYAQARRAGLNPTAAELTNSTIRTTVAALAAALGYDHPGTFDS